MEAILGYVVRPYLKNRTNPRRENKQVNRKWRGKKGRAGMVTYACNPSTQQMHGCNPSTQQMHACNSSTQQMYACNFSTQQGYTCNSKF